MKRGEFFTPCRDCIMHVGGGCAEGRGNTQEEDGCIVTYFYDCNINEPMPTIPKRFVRYSEPLTVEKLTAAGWECNVNREHPYKRQFRKEGERFNEFCCDVMFVIFEDDKVSVYYYDDTADHKVDFRLNGQITVGEFNTLLDIVELGKFKI